MEDNHIEEKWSRNAKRRDRARAKMSQGKRWRAEEDADRLVDETLKIQEKKDWELEREQSYAGRDDAMNTAIKLTREDMSIRKIVI